MTSRLTANNYEFTYGDQDIVLNAKRNTLTVAGEERHLEPLPLQLLTAMLFRPKDIVNMRDHTFAGQQVIQNAMSKLRNELGEFGKLIETVKSKGYRFNGSVSRRLIDATAPNEMLRPGRVLEDTDLTLVERLNTNNEVEVWKANDHRGHTRIIKTAYTEKGTGRLEREFSIWQLVTEELGGDVDLGIPGGQNFSIPTRYLEFPFVEQDLDAWAASPDTLAGMSLEQRLDLFGRLLEAVAKLHRIGVIHGDLKPRNWLLAGDSTATAQPILTDLGNSKLLNEQLFAKHNIPRLGMTVTERELAGSMHYFAPELHAQDLSIGSDIYALGVMLYQFVVADLRKPLATGWQSEVADAALVELIDAATQGDPDKRLESVPAFSRQLDALAERRLELDEIKDLERWRMRRPWVASLLILALVGTLTSGYLAWRATQAQALAEAEAQRKENVVEFVANILRTADPRVEGVGPKPSLVAALDRAAKRLDSNQSLDTRSALTMSAVLRDVYGALGEFNAQVHEADRMVQLNTRQFGAQHPETLLSRLAKVQVMAFAGQIQEAEVLLDSVDVAIAQVTDSAYEAQLDYQQVFSRGRLLSSRLDFAAAADQYRIARELLSRIGSSDDPSLKHQLTVYQAEALARVQQIESALQLIEEISDQSFVESHGVAPWQQSDANRLKAQLLGFLQRHEEAIAVLEEEMVNLKAIYGPESFKVANNYTTLAHQKSAIGLYEESIRDFQVSLGTLCHETKGLPQVCALIRGNLGILQFHKGNSAATVEQLTLGGAQIRALTDSKVATSLFDYYLANALLDTGNRSTALDLATTLSAPILEQASPGGQWDARLEVLKERIALYTSPPEVREQAAQRASEILIERSVGEDEAQRVAGLPTLQEAL
ncbi:MAG: lipopolysaccharide kinase InaA family protein [Pseudomonadota bacterium]